MPFEGIDDTVAKAWEGAVAALGKAGARLSDETIALIPDMIACNAKGGFAPTEAFSIHRDRLKRRGGDVDQNIRARIERGGTVTAADYIDMAQERPRLIRAMDARMAGLDALILPTTPIVAPKMTEVATPRELRPEEHAAAAQHVDDQFLRPLRDLAAVAPWTRPVGGLDAGCAKRPG